VALNNTANYFDGPSVAQGSSGKWFASGTVTLGNTAASKIFDIKLWDGTNVVASAEVVGGTLATVYPVTVSLSGLFTSPPGNIRISARCVSDTNGKLLSSNSALGKDCTITAIKIG